MQWDRFKVTREGRDSNRDRQSKNKRGKQANEEESEQGGKRQR